MYKTPQLRSTFKSCDVEKVHAVVERSTFPSQKCKKGTGSDEKLKKCTPVMAQSTFPSQKCKKLQGSDHFLTFRCRKRVRRCGAKRISMSKVSKTVGFGPLLDGQMSFFLAGARDSAPCAKLAKHVGL